MKASIVPSVSRKLVLLFVMALLVSKTSPCQANDAQPVSYLNTQKDDFSALLIPMVEDSSSVFQVGNVLLKAVVDDNHQLKYSLSPVGNNGAPLSGFLPELEEGRHEGLLETYLPSGEILDKSHKLFFLDTTPPVISLINREEMETPVNSKLLIFHVNDGEKGSGVSEYKDESKVKVSAQNAKVTTAELEYDGSQLRLYVVIDIISDLAIAYNTSYSISVSLQDKAGNTGTFQESFETREKVDVKFEDLRCYYEEEASYYEWYYVASIGFSGSFDFKQTMHVGKTNTLTLGIIGYLGKDYNCPKACRQLHYGSKEVSIPSIDWTKNLKPETEVTTDSEYIEIRNASVSESGKIPYSITQIKPAPFSQSLAYLKIRFPKLQIHTLATRSCEKMYKYRGGKSAEAYDNTYEYETSIIPVFLETEPATFDFDIYNKNEKVYWDILTDAPTDGLLDLNASYFEVDGKKAFYSQNSKGFQAVVEAREGLLPYASLITANGFEWEESPGAIIGDNKNAVLYEGEVLVKLAPPRKDRVRFDRNTGRLTCKITDIGTPYEDLDIEFLVDGNPHSFTYDTVSGRFSSHVIIPPSSTASCTLKVKDRAEQQLISEWTLLGEISQNTDNSGSTTGTSPPQGDGGDGDSLRLGGDSYSFDPRKYPLTFVHKNENRLPGRTVLGETSDGLSIIRECEYIKLGLSNSWGLYQKYKYEIAELLEQLRKRSRQDLTIENADTGFNLNDFFIQSCSTHSEDLKAPVFYNITYNTNTGSLYSKIHDNGAPIAGVDTRYIFRYKNNWGSHNLYRNNGELHLKPQSRTQANVSQVIALPEFGEFYTLRLIAEDEAGNIGIQELPIVTPRYPPKVKIYQLKTAEGQRELYSAVTQLGEMVTARFSAEAKDDSAIASTGFWVDDEKIEPFAEDSNHWYMQFLSDWNKTSRVTSSLSSPEGYTIANYSDYFSSSYGVNLEEGHHQARFMATDEHGLSAQTTLDFSLSFAPVIYGFKVDKKYAGRPGAPILVATIYDKGKDLDSAGVSLAIDGNPIDHDLLYYDPNSSYFAVYGPLSINPGIHRATLTAIDNHGNSTSAELRIFVGEDSHVYDHAGNIGIGETRLLELENRNNDGFANPGEVIRLFIPLVNKSPVAYEHCSATLSSADSRIAIEKNMVEHLDLMPYQESFSTCGYDLHIDENLLADTLAEEYEVPLNLEVDCGDEDFFFDVKLPVYDPSVPIDNQSNTNRLIPPSSARPLSIRIASPGSGAEFYACDEFTLNGTFDTGFHELGYIESNTGFPSGFSCEPFEYSPMPAEGESYSGVGTFSQHCQAMEDGNHLLEVTIRTHGESGISATDSVSVHIEDWCY